MPESLSSSSDSGEEVFASQEVGFVVETVVLAVADVVGAAVIAKRGVCSIASLTLVEEV